MEERLQKTMAAAGVGSRRKCEELIAAGHVAVDGKIGTELGVKVDPAKANITVGGKPVSLHPDKVYVLLNKPRGYTSTRFDPHAKHIVLELLRDAPVGIYPVGRLDVDSEGLLILTNDGDFTFHLTHPSHELPKTYMVEARGKFTPNDLRDLSNGVELEDGKTAPAKVKLLGYDNRTATTRIELIIHEGRKRQVRRMLKAVNHPVQRLVRTKIGDVTIDNLATGDSRRLSKVEVAGLLASAVQAKPKPRVKRTS
jgi:pseudouridine synthase